MVIVNDNAVNEQFDKLTALNKGERGQGGLHTLTELLDAKREVSQVELLLGLGVDVMQLLGQPFLFLGEFSAFALKFGQVDEFVQMKVEQALLLAVELSEAHLQGLALTLQSLRQPGARLHPLKLVGNAGGVVEESAEVLPDQVVEGLHGDSGGRAAFVLGAHAIKATVTKIVEIATTGSTAGSQVAAATADKTA